MTIIKGDWGRLLAGFGRFVDVATGVVTGLGFWVAAVIGDVGLGFVVAAVIVVVSRAVEVSGPGAATMDTTATAKMRSRIIGFMVLVKITSEDGLDPPLGYFTTSRRKNP